VPDRFPLSLWMFGPLEVMVDGAALGKLGGPQQRRVLAVLVVDANRVVSSDRLIEVLWGERPPASASHTLHTLVSRLRSGLGGDRVETVAPGYRLRVEAGEVDGLRFEELVRTGLGLVDRPEAAAARFEEALALWRGRPYEEFAEEEFARAEVARLEELRLCALEEHARALVELGRPGEVIGVLEAQIEAVPFRERLRAVLMLALARAGRPVEALRAFDAYRSFLADEMGVVPSTALQDLNDDILRQHPDLGWERTSRSGAVPSELPTGTVTFLFTDLERSTRLWQEHPDTMGEALARHDAILRNAVESHHGVIVKTTGDGVHAVFANARDAIDAAIAAQCALQAEAWDDTGPLRVRMGVHTGSAERRGSDYYGPAVNQAARLMGIAHGGQIVCSGVVAELIDGHVELIDLGAHRLRDVESALRVFQILAPGLESQFPPLNSLDARRSNLPQEMGTFVGRIDDVTALVKAFAQARVVSVVGVGGVGKTRLALRVGSKLLPTFPDGVWWCELAGVRDPDAVTESVAAAVGYAPSQGVALADGLTAFFRHKQLLLVLDNCEQILGAVATFVRTMSTEAPQLSVLATSREALSIQGEQTYLLPPLELPLDTSPFEVEESEAGALFATRAREARPSFIVTVENAAAIAELCARLDANALAIELAAARTTVMSPSEILDRLEQRFRLLKSRSGETAERHQTLHAAIDWSYELLDPTEQALLQRLSVFVGDFDLAAATAMAAAAGLDEFDAVDRLGSLVAKSLVERSEAMDVSRYRLLETIRLYAAERLEAEGSTKRARDAHAAHYLVAGRELFAMLKTPRDFEALEQLRIDTPNLAEGLRWLLASDNAPAVLGFFANAGWVDSGLVPFVLLDELGRLADEALSLSEASQTRGYVDALYYAGLRGAYVGASEHGRPLPPAGGTADSESASLLQLRQAEAFFCADFASAVSIGNAAVEAARRADDRGCWSFMLGLLYIAEMGLGTDPIRALAHVEEAVEVARHSPGTSALLYPLAVLSGAILRTDPDRALAAAEECVRLDQTHRKAWSRLCAAPAATLRLDRGELATGLLLWRDLLQQLHWSGEIFHISLQLPSLADSIAGIDPALALELTAIAGAIVPYAVFDGIAAYERLAPAVDNLGPDAVEAASALAASLSYDGAMEYVFDGIDRLITATAEP
jgi:predicted ATPase/class 3 adenylate cyclase/DNA-binding SARP family transcriptional activator